MDQVRAGIKPTASPRDDSPDTAGTVRLRFLGSGDNFGSGGRFQACIHVDAGRSPLSHRLRRLFADPDETRGDQHRRDRCHPDLPSPRGPFRRHPLFHPRRPAHQPPRSPARHRRPPGSETARPRGDGGLLSRIDRGRAEIRRRLCGTDRRRDSPPWGI